jgi:BirA family transcriptional regulator, biotin operon repressor / biotin---[acetyl-CoA-carboxylase] ligase
VTSSNLPADIAEALAIYGDRLGLFSQDVTWHPRIASTNDAALALADHGAAEGTVIAADMQTAGRGRHGRAWSSPAGAGLYVSVILRPVEGTAPLLTIAAGVAIADGIAEATGLQVALKWPNDVYVSGRKLAGILAEAGTASTGIGHVVLGFGINLMPAAYPPDVAARATSLEVELGRPVDRGLLLAACLAALALRYRQLSTDAPGVANAWRRYAAAMLGRPVECIVGLQALQGIAEDIDQDGALVVRTAAGVTRIISGEVLWQ